MLSKEFIEDVRYNCNVSDANYWGYFSICTLLLRFRELFKIEENLEPWDPIENKKISAWIEIRENLWKEFENKKLKELKLNGELFLPFDVERINSIISKYGFAYGAGYALFMKPSFFLGRIKNYEKIEGYDVYIIEKEIVRDIFSSPGMSIGKTIFIRITDIKFRLWDEIQTWLNKKGNIYDFLRSKLKNPSRFDYSFEEFFRIVEKYCSLVLYHEISEQEESNPDWRELIKQCKNNSKTEHILRGIQDLIADFSEKGVLNKAIIEKDKELLYLYLASQGPYQKKILKGAILQIEKALLDDEWEKINKVRISQFEKWKSNYNHILEIFKLKGFEQVRNITNKIFDGGLN